MRSRLPIVACLLVLAGALPPAAALGRPPLPLRASAIPDNWAAFTLPGSNGYSISFAAYGGPVDGKGRIGLQVSRKGEFASYSTDAVVTATALEANLGSYGHVSLSIHRSGRKEPFSPRCSKAKIPFEPATLEGLVEFRGEMGYTAVRASSVPLEVPYPSFCGGSGYGEARGPGLPGARLAGVSYGHDRALSFQINKNGPHAPVLFEASLRERQGAISIRRAVIGKAPARSFRFNPTLSSATVEPPAPFTGSASLTRIKGALFPRWGGNLALQFPGRRVSLADRSVHVAIDHARLTRSGGSSVTVGF